MRTQVVTISNAIAMLHGRFDEAARDIDGMVNLQRSGLSGGAASSTEAFQESASSQQVHVNTI